MTRSTAKVIIWPTASPAEAAALPSFEVRGDRMDVDGEVEMANAEGLARLTLWNIGTPKEALALFGPNRLVAVDLAVATGTKGFSFERPFLGRLTSFRPIPRENGDQGYRIEAEPLANLQQFEVLASYLPQAKPYPVEDIIRNLLEKAGLGPHSSVRLSRSAFVDSFTADGPVLSEVRRVADEAGMVVGSFMQGGMVVVSDQFVSGVKLTDGDVFDAYPVYDRTATAAPAFRPPLLDALDSDLDLAEDLDPEDDVAQIAVGETPAGGAYEVVARLLPNLFVGTRVVLAAPRALERMGLAAGEQAFNVLKVTHRFSTSRDAPVDETLLLLAKAGGA